MKKIMLFFLTFALVLALSACGGDSEIENSESLIPSEAEISVSEPEASFEEPENDFYFASLISDDNLPDSFMESAEEYAAQKVVYEEDVAMSAECREIYDKYIAYADIVLSAEFSESEIPFSFLTHVYYACERFDYDVLGIEKSGYDMAETYWIKGTEAEERLCRWFPWTAENIRNHFEYNSKTGEYSLPGAGGGPYYSYVTDFEYTEDGILRIYLSEYDGYLEEGPYPVMDSFVLDVRLNEDGSWTYLSNKRTDKSIDPIWYSEDVFFGAGYEDWNYGGTSTYTVFAGEEVNRITINGSLAHKMYFDVKPCSFFISSNGLWVYGYDSLGLRHISSLPSGYEGIHSIKDVWFDSEERIIISYAAENSSIEIAVFDYETLEVINYIDTGIFNDGEVDIPFGLKPETITDGNVEIYDNESQSYKNIEYMK